MENLNDTSSVDKVGELDPFGMVNVNLATLRGDVLRSFLAKVESWLPSYATWVVSDAGIVDGKNLHAIYRFGLSLSNCECVEPVDQIIALATCARRLGLALTFSIHSVAIEQKEHLFTALLESRAISSLIVITSFDAGQAPNWEMLRRSVFFAKNLGIAVSFVGEYTQIHRHVLENRWVDEKNFSIYPRQSTQRHGGRRNCHGRVGCYVASNGKVYPCHSLIGVASAEMGSIESDRPFRIASLPILRRSMMRWELHGPTNALDFTAQERRNGEMCNAHRTELDMTGIVD